MGDRSFFAITSSSRCHWMSNSKKRPGTSTTATVVLIVPFQSPQTSSSDSVQLKGLLLVMSAVVIVGVSWHPLLERFVGCRNPILFNFLFKFNPESVLNWCCWRIRSQRTESEGKVGAAFLRSWFGLENMVAECWLRWRAKNNQSVLR